MESTVIWKDKMAFEGLVDGFTIPMDATPPLGHNYGINPKQLLLIAAAGCSGMDVVGILKKRHQTIDRFEIETQVVSISHSHPIVFSNLDMVFRLYGSIDDSAALSAVKLSQTTYSGVSAMLCQSVGIRWSVFVNDTFIGEGRANFDHFEEINYSAYEG